MTVNKPNGRMAYGSGGSHPLLMGVSAHCHKGTLLPPAPARVVWGSRRNIFQFFIVVF